MFVQGQDSLTGLRVVFEDDGRTAYGYLVRDKVIVSDVWVYNHGAPPEHPEWDDPSRAPFRNPKAYARSETIEPATREDDIAFAWAGTAEKRSATITLRGVVLGVLTLGSRPGRARMAAADGPLARTLVEKTSLK